MTIHGDNNGSVNNNINNINFKIEINPITKLDVSHIAFSQMQQMIEEFSDKLPIIGGKQTKNNDRLSLILSDYIKKILCDKEHPENHAVKYTRKKPPTYKAVTENSNGDKVNVIANLKETCELLTDPVLDLLKVKLKEFIKKYRKDDQPEFDYVLYEETIKELKKEFNKDSVKRALKGVLQNDILDNIEMKISAL